MASEEPRDYLMEAIGIIRGNKMMLLTERDHLIALWIASRDDIARAQRKVEALEP